MKTLLLFTLLSVFYGTPFAGIVSVDKTVHDWGDVTVSDGPLDCTFTIKNITARSQKILSVNKTCGCTKVSWTKEPIEPSGYGYIHVTYANDDGAFAFDKTLNVHFDGVKKPLVLHIKGDVHERKLPVSETYPIHFEGIGIKKNNIKVGNVLQGESVGTEFMVANVSDREATLSWTGISGFLHIFPDRTVLKPGGTASVHVAVDASRTLWGKNFYSATPVVNGKAASGELRFYAVTRENFASWTPEQLQDAPAADYETILEAAPAPKGEKMEARFEVSNSGRTPLVIYKTEYDPAQLSCTKEAEKIDPGQKAEFRFEVKTEAFEKDSDNYSVATLYPNDPQHPMLHLYIPIIVL